MYRTRLCVGRNKQFWRLHSARSFNSVKLQKASEKSTLTSQTDYYDFENDENEILSDFIENLSNSKTKATHMEPISKRPTFEEITTTKFKTSQDIQLSLYSKDIVTTYNLFTACLRAKEFERALSLLSSMHMLIRNQKNKTPMIDAFNSYFSAWAQDEKLTVDDITRFFNESLSTYSNFSFDDRTYAILIDAVMSRSTNPSECKVLARMYLENCNKTNLKGLFRHADIFSMGNLKRMVEILNVPKEDIPKDLQEFFETEEETNLKREEEAIKLLRQFSFENDEIPLLEKDSEYLKGVDSFGLRVIRHSIMALASKNKSEVLAEFAEKLSSATPVESSAVEKSTEDIDLFSIYKSLSEEDQEAFDNVLEEFNFERQLSVETKGIDSAREKWRHSYEQLQKAKVIAPTENLNKFLYIWQQDLTELIKKEIEICDALIKKGDKRLLNSTSKERETFKGRLAYAPFLKVVSPEKLSVITIMELLKTDFSVHSQVLGLRTTKAVLAVGSSVETEFNSQERLKSTEDVLERRRLRKFFKSGSQKAKLFLKKKQGTEDNLDDPLLGWTHDVRAKLGSILITLLLQVAKVPVKAIDPITKKEVEGHVPAFYHSFQYLSGTKVGMIKLQPDFATMLSKEDVGSIITPQGLPMLVKPRPWTSFRDGGYLTIRTLLLRSKNSAEQMAYLRAASENEQLDTIYKGVNVLGETAWTVNKKVFKTIAQVWNTGKPFLDIPGIIETPSYPERPPRNSLPELIRNWKQEVQKISNEFGKNRSLRCDTNYKLEIARAFLGEKFYFPHNLDFRGRAYPLSPHFNHLGNDLTRSLLIFWKGKKLGPEGLDWLKVHISNLFGIDKVSLEERIAFANKNMEKFEKCCQDPLSEEGSFWMSADKPWQALATMFEIVELNKMEDPSQFVSHQPVHQDGTCNGLQHYAALGGDIEGATQVNLIPQDKPADVYSHVAKLVQDRVDRDVALGNPTAIGVQHHIKRKVVKQTIMTSVYGVTFVGAREQIAKQLFGVFLDKGELNDHSRYLTTQVFLAIRELFSGAHLIQDWLTDAAKTISKSFYLYEDETKQAPATKPEYINTVVWTTPLGLPIVQPYRSISKRQVHTNLQTVYINDPFLISPVDSRKQQSALPPNFVHSLDATHMLKSSVRCGENDITFTAVHDSYWTHASDISSMNKILRDEFVDLYQLNIIQDLKDEFEKRYSDYVQLVSLPKKSPVIDEVAEIKLKWANRKSSPVTFHDELFFEVERRKLLNSTNPKDVLRAKEIKTTISCVGELDLLKEPFGANKGSYLAPFKLPPVPKRGDLDISCVKDSLYFFS